MCVIWEDNKITFKLRMNSHKFLLRACLSTSHQQNSFIDKIIWLLFLYVYIFIHKQYTHIYFTMYMVTYILHLYMYMYMYTDILYTYIHVNIYQYYYILHNILYYILYTPYPESQVKNGLPFHYKFKEVEECKIIFCG